MAMYISKIVGEEITANGSKRNVTKSFLVDKDGNILHDMAKEDDADGVNRRIEVEAHKEALRQGYVLRVKELNADGHETGRWKYNSVELGAGNISFNEEFKGTMDQAEKEISAELEFRKKVEDEMKAKIKQAKDKK